MQDRVAPVQGYMSLDHEEATPQKTVQEAFPCPPCSVREMMAVTHEKWNRPTDPDMEAKRFLEITSTRHPWDPMTDQCLVSFTRTVQMKSLSAPPVQSIAAEPAKRVSSNGCELGPGGSCLTLSLSLSLSLSLLHPPEGWSGTKKEWCAKGE